MVCRLSRCGSPFAAGLMGNLESRACFVGQTLHGSIGTDNNRRIAILEAHVYRITVFRVQGGHGNGLCRRSDLRQSPLERLVRNGGAPARGLFWPAGAGAWPGLGDWLNPTTRDEETRPISTVFFFSLKNLYILRSRTCQHDRCQTLGSPEHIDL